jgi:hypothetical protein
MAENQYGFPTEVLSLPSQGLLYPEDSPLRSGTIDVKYMTAKEEDILTSTNLIQQGVVIDKLLESVIANPEVKLDEMLVGDKNALLVGTRVLGYGKEYKINFKDPDTGAKVEHSVDLTTLKNKEVDLKSIEGKSILEFELPNSKRVIEFKLLTHSDEIKIAEDIKGYEKIQKITGISTALTTRLKYQIVSVDGKKDRKIIDNFVDNEFLALDHREFRQYTEKVTPDIELKFDYTSQTGNLHTLDIPLGIGFFWPAAGK